MLHNELMTFNATNTLSLLHPVVTETSVKYEALVLSAHEISTISAFPFANPDPEDGLITLRYLITAEGENRFALEGRPSLRIAPHEAMPRIMSDACRFASNISVNANNEIVKLNNKSSNYQTPKSHLPYGIMALRMLTLYHPGFKLAETITIEVFHRDPTSNVRITEHKMSRDEFIQLADAMIAVCRSKPEYYDSEKQFLFDYNDARIQRLKAKYPPTIISNEPLSSRPRSETKKKKALNFNRPEQSQPISSPESIIAISNNSIATISPSATLENRYKFFEEKAPSSLALNASVQSLHFPYMSLPLRLPSLSLPSKENGSTAIPLSMFHLPHVAAASENPLKRKHEIQPPDLPSDTDSEPGSNTSTDTSFEALIKKINEDDSSVKVIKLR